MMENESSIHYRGWRIALASTFCVFVSFASLLVYTFGIFLKPWALEFHWTREEVSTAFGIAALSVAVCSPFIGSLLDRVSARRVFVPCLVIFGAGFASLSLLTPHLWQMYTSFMVLGVVGIGTGQLAYSRVISTWFRERRGAAFALLMSGAAVGAMVLPVLAQRLIDHYGWRTACVALGAMVLVVGLPAGQQIREQPVTSDSAGQLAMAHGSSTKEAVRSYIFWVLIAVLFLISIGQNASIAHLAAILTDRGISGRMAALAVSALGAATLAGRVVTGWLLDRHFAPFVSFGLIAVSAVGIASLSIAHSAGSGILAASLIGIGLGGETDVTPYLLANYFGLRSFSTLYGLTWSAYAIAGAIGPLIMGRSFDNSGSYASLLIRLALLTVAAASLMFLLPRYKVQGQ